MKKIVLTGATSMIGVALIKECIENNVQVLAIVRSNSQNIMRIPKSELVNIVECDLDNLKELTFTENKYDVFYHLAWDYTSRTYRDEPCRQNKNVNYTLDAVNLASKLGCHTFIGAGSQAEYGRVENSVITPNTPINPDIAYGIAKYSAGKLSRLMCRDLGMKHIWTRIFSVYGPYDNSNTMIMYAINKFLAKERPSFTKSEQLWDYLYSGDAAQALYLLGIKGKDKSVYCIGSGIVHPLYDYIYKIRDTINTQLLIGIGDKKYSENQVMNLCADITNLIEDTGFKPKYSFDEGIKLTIEWVKNKK
jgi:Nucleoside-diphosphate-sugar epimerases